MTERERLTELKAGDDVWVVECDDGVPYQVSCVLYLAMVKDAVIASSFIEDYDIDETLAYMIDETANGLSVEEMMVFPASGCYATREEAEAALAERRNAK